MILDNFIWLRNLQICMAYSMTIHAPDLKKAGTALYDEIINVSKILGDKPFFGGFKTYSFLKISV